MHVAINLNNADLVEPFKSYAERRLRFALGRFGGRVGHVTVRISEDGPTQHRCRISAEVLPFGRVAVEETDPDLFAAIDRATGRIGRLFGRELERAREARVGRESVRLAA
ncbi:MAG: HPF/RaiA family ribosome-associated protein [Acidobacteriaceae bacterium]